MTVLVVGQGAVGRALKVGLAARQISADFYESWLNSVADPIHWRLYADTVIYASGPAGEAACRRNPMAACSAHYGDVMQFVRWLGAPTAQRPRRMVLISSVLTDGLYGALKSVALDHARERVMAGTGTILALRCGQIIGPEMPVDGTGVVATWVRQAVRGERLRVDSADVLDVTLCGDLIDRLATWLKAPITVPWEEERVCLPDPIPLPALARVCGLTARIASGATDDPAAHIVDGSKARVPFEVFVAVQGMAENALRAPVPEAR